MRLFFFRLLQTLAKNFPSLKYGLPHRRLVGLVLPGDVIARTVVRGSANDRESGCEIYPVFKGNGFERDQSLVMIHSEHSIILSVLSRAKKTIRRKRPENQFAFVSQ